MLLPLLMNLGSAPAASSVVSSDIEITYAIGDVEFPKTLSTGVEFPKTAALDDVELPKTFDTGVEFA